MIYFDESVQFWAISGFLKPLEKIFLFFMTCVIWSCHILGVKSWEILCEIDPFPENKVYNIELRTSVTYCLVLGFPKLDFQEQNHKVLSQKKLFSDFIFGHNALQKQVVCVKIAF